VEQTIQIGGIFLGHTHTQSFNKLIPTSNAFESLSGQLSEMPKLKEVTQYSQRMITPSSTPTLNYVEEEHHIPASTPAAGTKVEITDNGEDTKTTIPSANYNDIGVAENSQMVSF
jgi:hypothetical protein